MGSRFEPVLQALNDAGVRYLVVGGVAVVLHGHLRTTADLDLVVQLTTANLTRALDVLDEAGFKPRSPVPLRAFADPGTRRSWIEEKNLEVFSLWHPDLPGFDLNLPVDEPFDFDEVWERRVDVPLATTRAPVVSRHDLMALERSSGRPQDLADVAALEALQRAEDDG